MALKVLGRSKVGSDVISEYKSLLDDSISIEVETDLADARKKMEGVQILVDGRPDAEMLEAPRLERVVVPDVGINDDLRELMLKRPHLKLHNSHFNSGFVAQHAVALLLA